ncbi:MAG: arylesterase [Sulfurimonas sp.]|nr:arylesterase [Sulfurimonas sp.]
MLKYLLIILAIIGLIFFFKKETPEVIKLNPTDKILAFGDSITYGYGESENESYPYLLSQSTNTQVINAGINGDTSQDGLQRLPALLEDNSIKLILLCFGGNDILQNLPLGELKNNLKKMIQLAKAKNVDVILISVPKVSDLGLSSMNLYSTVAEEENIELMDNLLVHILSRSSLKNDYIHPNAKGYRYMADEIFKHLKSNKWI